jgi:hypothetical protein
MLPTPIFSAVEGAANVTEESTPSSTFLKQSAQLVSYDYFVVFELGLWHSWLSRIYSSNRD